jgi:aminocarboxymuconate-semialdehyde decarboxylase
MRTIDVHAHILTPECASIAGPIPSPEKDPFTFFSTPETAEANRRMFAQVQTKLLTPEERIEDMKRMGVDIQVISPSPTQYFYWTDGPVGARLSRMQNDRIKEIVKRFPSRFIGLGTLPLQAVDLALEELARVMNLGFAGVEISTNVNGTDLDHPQFSRFFARAEALGALLFVHPIGFTHADRMRDCYLNNIVGQPLESTLAISRLILGGVLERHPRLNICIAHGGGYLPFYPGRLDHAWRVRPECRLTPRPPSTYLAKLYFDSVVYSTQSLSNLVRQVGSDRLVMGTDYPFDMGESDPVGLIERTPDLSSQDRSNILGENAARLLKLEK